MAKKINDANYSIFLEQAKAKAKAIEFEAESILKDAKVKVNEAEFEAKKRYEEKGSRLQKEYNQKLDDISKKEHAILNEQEILKNSKDELEKSQNQAKTLYEEGLNLKIAYQDKLSETLKVLEHVAGLTEDEAKNMVLRKVEEKSRAEIAHIVRKYEEEAKKEAKKRAIYILAQATSRYAGEFAVDV